MRPQYLRHSFARSVSVTYPPHGQASSVRDQPITDAIPHDSADAFIGDSLSARPQAVPSTISLPGTHNIAGQRIMEHTSQQRDHGLPTRTSRGSSVGAAEAARGNQRGVEISARHVWDAFECTRPSLSHEDRLQYESAYRKFRGGSRPADFNPVSSVDDGTLRTALR